MAFPKISHSDMVSAVAETQTKIEQLNLMTAKMTDMDTMSKKKERMWLRIMRHVQQLTDSITRDDLLLLINTLVNELFPRSNQMYGENMAVSILEMINENTPLTDMFNELVRRESSRLVSMTYAIDVLNSAATYYAANNTLNDVNMNDLKQLRKLLDDAMMVEQLFKCEHPLHGMYTALSMQATELINSVDQTE